MAKFIRVTTETFVNLLVIACFSRVVLYIEMFSHVDSLKLYLISLAVLYIIEISAVLFFDIRVSYRKTDKKSRKILKIRECFLVISIFVVILTILALVCLGIFVIFGTLLDVLIKIICWLPNIFIVHLFIDILILLDNS